PPRWTATAAASTAVVRRYSLRPRQRWRRVGGVGTGPPEDLHEQSMGVNVHDRSEVPPGQRYGPPGAGMIPTRRPVPSVTDGCQWACLSAASCCADARW